MEIDVVIRKGLLLPIFLGVLMGQDSDSLNTHTPKKAALYAMLFPGAGQLYNNRPLKTGLMLGMISLAAWRWSVNGENYQNYTEDMALPKRRYLEKRNKYAWWMGFIYIYGLLDAVVDAHLINFNEVMEEDLEAIKKEE